MTASVSQNATVVTSLESTVNDAHSTSIPKYESIPAVRTVTERSRFIPILGFTPPRWRNLLKRLSPEYRKGSQATSAFARLAVTAVSKRLQQGRETEKQDDDGAGYNEAGGGNMNILTLLLEAKDENGKKMGDLEVCAEVVTLLFGGTDTTSK